MKQDNQKGFTLLEVMVAMAVVSIALVTIIDLFAGSIRVAERSYDYTRLSLLAKETMNDILAKTDLEEGEFSGDFSDTFAQTSSPFLTEEQQTDPYQLSHLRNLRWKYSVTPYEPELNEEEAPKEEKDKEGVVQNNTENESEQADNPKLYEINLNILWDEKEKTQQIELTSLALIIPKTVERTEENNDKKKNSPTGSTPNSSDKTGTPPPSS